MRRMSLGDVNASEGDGIAQALGRRDAVLPLRSCGSAQQVNRARLQDQGSTLPAAAAFAPEAKSARRAERDADDIAVGGSVPMPTDRGSGSVFGHQRLLQFGRREPREIGSLLTQDLQEGRNVLRA